MKVLVFLLSLLSAQCFASEGFSPSHERNVVMLKGKTDGGTAFVFNDPALGEVLVTQEHVLEVTGDSPLLQWGYEVGPFFRLHQVEPQAYKLEIKSDSILWRDKELDIAVLKLPEELRDLCHCSGFEPAAPQDGEASLIGYPIKERRIWPQTSDLLRAWRELMGKVRQQVSVGKIWQASGEYLGDIDAISGNSGGPVIQNGKVVGALHLLKTWKGEGYRYKNPSISFFPISVISDKLRGFKKRDR